MHTKLPAFAAIIILAATAWTGTAAAQPTGSGPLNPPPPPGYTCKAVGAGTICRAVVDIAVGPEITDIPCPGFDVYDTAAGHENRTRYYDGDGNLTRRVLHDLYSFGEWSNPLTGDVVTYTQNVTFTDVLATPGDLTTSTQTVTGETIIRGATGAPVLFGNGRQVFNFDESELISSAGRNDFVDAFYRGNLSALDKVCAALGK